MLIALRDANEHRKLNIFLRQLRDEGYRVADLAEVLGLTPNAVYGRLKTIKKHHAGEPPRGYPGYRSPAKGRTNVELDPLDIERIQQLYMIARKRPAGRGYSEAYDAWLNATIKLEELLSTALVRGVSQTYLAQQLGISSSTVAKRVSRYRNINKDWAND